MSPVAAALPQGARHDGRRIDFHVAVGSDFLAHVILQRHVHRPAVRVPENLTGIFGVKVEQVKLHAQLAVVALVRLFQHLEVVLQFVRLMEADGIDAAEHGAVGIPAPVCAGKAHQLE